MSSETDKLAVLEKEVSRLKIELDLLVTFLATVNDMPILGPNHKRQYEEAKKVALAAAKLA